MTEIAHSFADSAAYERFMGRWSEAVGVMFLDWIACPPGVDWLDVGCGTGIFTQLVLDKCAPAAVVAVDPMPAQVEHARRQPIARHACFGVADARALPFPDARFDVVAAALVLNFIPDRARGLSEMRRVARPGGIIAGYVWDFSQELSPSWPLRLGMRQEGIDVPQVPGMGDSTLDALKSLFRRAGLDDIATTSIAVTRSYVDFDDFWAAQTPSYSPTTTMIAAMSTSERHKLREVVRAWLPHSPEGGIQYAARANAIKARAPIAA